MSKSSIVTTRAASGDGMPAAAGSLAVRAETITVETADRIQLTDITSHVATFVKASGVRDGIVSLWSMHTTCAVFINETQKALHEDIKRFLEHMVARDAQWMHNDPDHSDCDRMNADSHLRAMLLGHSLTVQVAGNELVLGQWQRILIAELDGPRTRSIRLQAIGIVPDDLGR
jgi:secondary thiamine-phosphate synthase enzyme